MKNLIYFLLMWLSATAYAQVTGNAQLMGETDHSGIKVLFNAVSPTAKTDSTVTDVKGDYTKSLMAGTYSVKFQKSGFYDSTYKQNVFVNGGVKLDTLELISRKVVYVKGEVSGIWNKDSIYIIMSDFIVPKDKELVMNPGTRVFFSKDYCSLILYGGIKINGDVNENVFFF